jgi:hypothetical protein
MTARGPRRVPFDFLCNETHFPIQKAVVVAQLGVFDEHPSLLEQKPYRVRSHVSTETFKVFLHVVLGDEIEITRHNVRGLGELSEEFDFGGVDKELEEYRRDHPGDEESFEVPNEFRHHFSCVEEEIEALRVLMEEVLRKEENAEQRGRLENIEGQLGCLSRRFEEVESKLERSLSEQGEAVRGLGEKVERQGRELEAERKEVRELREMQRSVIEKQGVLEGARERERQENEKFRREIEGLVKGLGSGAAAPGTSAPPAVAPSRAAAPAVKAGRREIACEFKGEKLKGMIAYLTKEYGGNVADKGIVRIIGRPLDDSRDCAAKNVADLEGNSYFLSVDRPSQSICYDFQRRRIKVTHYTLRSRWNGRVGGENPKSWVIEVSDDGTNWTEIDRKVDNAELNGKNLCRSQLKLSLFECV